MEWANILKRESGLVGSGCVVPRRRFLPTQHFLCMCGVRVGHENVELNTNEIEPLCVNTPKTIEIAHFHSNLLYVLCKYFLPGAARSANFRGNNGREREW